MLDGQSLALGNSDSDCGVASAARVPVTKAPFPEGAALRTLQLYCAFADARTVKDVLIVAARDAPVLIDSLDHRAFVAFGLVHGVLRRVHRYPTIVQASRPPLKILVPHVVVRLIALADGSRCMDEICSEVDVSPATCDAELATHGYAIVNTHR